MDSCAHYHPKWGSGDPDRPDPCGLVADCAGCREAAAEDTAKEILRMLCSGVQAWDPDRDRKLIPDIVWRIGEESEGSDDWPEWSDNISRHREILQAREWALRLMGI